MTDTMYLARLEAAVLKSFRNTEFYGPSGDDQWTGCYHCNASMQYEELAHDPDCIITALRKKYP